MGKINSRAKGARAEREAAKFMRDVWHCEGAMRGQQRSGLEQADVVEGLPGTHAEIKHYNAIAALKFLRQAERDAGEDATPYVLMRENGDTEWVMMFRAKDFINMAKAAKEQGLLDDRNEEPAALPGS